METLDVNDEQAKVEAEIEASKVHWSELTSSYFTALEGPAIAKNSSTSSTSRASDSESLSEEEARQQREQNMKVAEDNVLVFQRLQDQYPGGFFLSEHALEPDRIQQLPKWMIDQNGRPQPWDFKLSTSEEPFAKRGQNQLFHADLVNLVDGSGSTIKKGFAVTVFNEGASLREFKLLPRSLLSEEEDSALAPGKSRAAQREDCNAIAGVQLSKPSGAGRFVFLMRRAWGTLRKLIDTRMLHFDNQGPPFSDDEATCIMLQIARGMRDLHAKDVTHTDLKADRVLVCGCEGEDVLQGIDPMHWKPLDFECSAANFEHTGFIWNGFWRAPEILSALNDRSFQIEELFGKEADVYSFGMTCYEIISGGIPFEGLCLFDVNIVIGGTRPVLPSQTTPWVKDLLCRCWHKDPSMRPTFEDIIQVILLQSSKS